MLPYKKEIIQGWQSTCCGDREVRIEQVLGEVKDGEGRESIFFLFDDLVQGNTQGIC